MIRLFHYEGYEVEIEPEALMLAPFKAIYDRDKSKDKSMAKQELAYIYFMEDPRSDYQYLVDSEVRNDEVIKGLGMPKGWKADKVIERALTFYGSFKPMSAGLLEDTRYFVNNLRKKLRAMDFYEKDDKGKIKSVSGNYYISSNWEAIIKILKIIDKKMPHIKAVVLDDKK